ncbi:MAG: hypothetical protein HY579_02840 [Nitrospinae bacterium]|nr:hypothetical protein [Nitrospinota bacterium]
MIKTVSSLFLALWILGSASVFAETPAGQPCEPPETQPVKLEGWISKKFRKDQKAITQEFASMGHTRVDLRVFPMGDTAQVVAVGRCVPAYIARHILSSALKYTGGIAHVVNPDFVSPNWVGIGATIFDEPSQQKVTEDQVQQLLDEKLSTEEFHALYKQFSLQNENATRWGQTVPNIKRPDKIGDR